MVQAPTWNGHIHLILSQQQAKTCTQGLVDQIIQSLLGVYIYIYRSLNFSNSYECIVLLTVRMCQLTDTAELSPTSSLKCQAYTDFEENDPFISKADGDIEVNIMIFLTSFII